MRRSFSLAAAALACAGSLTLMGPAPRSGAATIPAAAVPTALQQLDWMAGASARAPLTAAEIEQHVDAPVLAALGGTAGFNTLLAQAGTITVRNVVLDQPAQVEAIIGATVAGPLVLTLATDAAGLIGGLNYSPYVPSPRSWQQLDADLAGLAAQTPEVSFATMTIGQDGSCHLVHGVNATTPRPLGSAFKLYVLGALGRAIAEHKASWDEDLAINDAWKSLPSGVLQNEPAGTELPLETYADYMIAISDNTAADHLIHFLGRDAVQAQLFRFGNRNAKPDIPFLTTRELFALRSVNYPSLADSYLADTPAQRAAELNTLDQIPLSQIQPWTQPEQINQIEWFASPADICRAYAGLWRENSQPGLSPIGQALSISDAGIGLDRTRYPLVWYKGGSEPGVLTVNYLARAADGKLIVSSVMLANPGSAFSELGVLGTALALARGGIQLADVSR
jgi:hypothetical protein